MAVGLELGIRLGHRDEAIERAGERRLALDALAELVARLHHAGARRDHHLQRLALVPGVALHGLHEIGDEVVPPLELDVDAGPALLHELREAGEAVVGGDEPDERQTDDDRRHAARGAETS